MTKDEVLMMADVLSREKELEKDVVFLAIEAALATATRKRNREDIEVRVSIDQETGDYEAFRQWEIVDVDADLESPTSQMTLAAANISYPDVAHEVGGFVEEPLEVVAKFGRIEALRNGDRIKSILTEVRSEARGPQLILDRRSPELVIKLFRLEVPEVGQGVIEVLGASRDPGSRAKIAVRSNDPKIDPVGACVGIRGARVQSVSNELNLERIDIITWTESPAEFVIKALQPAEVDSIIIDEESRAMDVVVDENQLSLAIGRGGQNVRLASELTGWQLNIMTDEAALEKAELESQASC